MILLIEQSRYTRLLKITVNTRLLKITVKISLSNTNRFANLSLSITDELGAIPAKPQ